MYTSPQVAYLYQVAGTLPPPQPPTTEVIAARVVVGNLDGTIFTHGLETLDVVHAFTPSRGWYTSVYFDPNLQTTGSFRTFFSVPSPYRAATIDYVVSKGTGVTVPPDATSYTINHGYNDASAVVLVSTNWNTQIYKSTKTANTLLVNFSVPAPAGARLFYSNHYSAYDYLTSGEAVADWAESHVLTHNLGKAGLPVFALPSWPTVVTAGVKGDTQTEIHFSVAAPPGGTVDAMVKFI